MRTVFSRNGDVVEIVIKDSTMRKIGSWKFNTADKKLGERIMKDLEDKYGFRPEISNKESVNEIQKNKVKEIEEEEIDWLNMKSDW